MRQQICKINSLTILEQTNMQNYFVNHFGTTEFVNIKKKNLQKKYYRDWGFQCCYFYVKSLTLKDPIVIHKIT